MLEGAAFGVEAHDGVAVHREPVAEDVVGEEQEFARLCVGLAPTREAVPRLNAGRCRDAHRRPDEQRSVQRSKPISQVQDHLEFEAAFLGEGDREIP